MNLDEEPMWAPSAEQVARANMTRFIEQARSSSGGRVVDFNSLYDWSVDCPEKFWPLVWEFCDVRAEKRADGSKWDSVLIGRDRMAPPDEALGPEWFTGARLNFAENLLKFGDNREALVS